MEGMTEFIQGDIQTLLESVPRMTSLYLSIFEILSEKKFLNSAGSINECLKKKTR